MAAIAGSAHIMYSMDRKPDRKGWDRTHRQQDHPLPLGPPFTFKYWLATGSPPEVHKQSPQKAHSTHKTKMRSRLAKNALILLSCGQLPVFSTTVVPVANFTRITIPGSFWPHPPPTTNTRIASSATPLHESTTKKPFLHIHPRTLKTNQGTTLKRRKEPSFYYLPVCLPQKI